MSTKEITALTTAAAIQEAATNPYLAEAFEEMAAVRRIAENYIEEVEPRPLTPAERRLVRITSAEGIERAALFGDAAPNVAGPPADVAEMRDVNHYLFAKLRVRDEVATLLQRIDDSLARKTLKGARLARLFYNVARVYVKTDAGHAMKPHVEEMKRSLTRPRRRKPATPSVPDAPTPPENVTRK